MLRPLLRVATAAVAFVVAATAQLPGPQTALAPAALFRALDVSAATLQSLDLPPVSEPEIAVSIVFDGVVERVELWPFDVRAPGFQLWQRGPVGVVPVAAPPCNTWRGHVRGEPDSVVAASITNGSLTAYVRRASGELWIVQPLRSIVASAAPTLHAVFRGSECTSPGAVCGAGTAPVPITGPAISGDVVFVCDLALEADHALFLQNAGNVAATQNDVLAVVNAVDAIYRADVQIQMQVAHLIVDTAPDPYTTNVASQLCAQFRSHWNMSHAALQRDVAHLFTGRALSAAVGGHIGYAYLGTVCNPLDAYGVSQTQWSPNFAYRVAVTAHELGHSFNAAHCDTQPACSLMCSTVGGCAANPNAFSAAEQAQIVAFRQNATCLAVVPTVPQITSVTPVVIPTVDPPMVTIGGTGLFGTTVVTVGGQNVTAGIQVVSDSLLRVVPPAGLPLGFHPVSVTNPAGTSNASVLWYTASDPCRLIVADGALGGATLTWTLGGWPSDIGYLGVSFFNSTSPLLGQPVLDNMLWLWVGVLDTRGMAELPVGLPASVMSGWTLYSQMLDVTQANTLRSVSTVQSTVVAH